MTDPQPKTKEFAFFDHRDGASPLRVPPHLHRELELVCLFEGSLSVRVDTQLCELRAGDLLLIFPEQVHSFEDEQDARYYRIRVSPDLFPDLALHFDGRVPEQPILIGALYLSKISSLLEALEEVVRSTEAEHEYSQSVCRGYLLALLSELCAMTSFRRVGGETTTIRAIVAFCTANFAEDLSLDLLAERLGLNKFYISHLFGEGIGLPFNDFVNFLRIREACRYLRHTSLPVSDVCELVGFNTPRTFNRAFIKHFGTSPSEYRRSGAGAEKSSG